jgi:tetratricopeptide (TPR) repeat protein
MNKIFLLFLFIFTINTFSFSEKSKSEEPSWVYLKRAENLKEKGEFSQAIVEARKAKEIFVTEELNKFYEKIREEDREKTDYELKKIVESKRLEMMQKDNYPEYHELMGDLYVETNFLQEAGKEYKKAIDQKKYFDYPKKLIELKYKLGETYEKESNYEAADIIYREIVEGYYKKKQPDFWTRLRGYVKQDPSLTRIFRLYREDGIEYFKAFYKIGRRSALLQRPDDALFYLANAGVVLMTLEANIIKKSDYGFQYSGPVDFIKYYPKKERTLNLSEVSNNFDETMFFIGYANKLKGKEDLKNYYFDLALKFSRGTTNEQEIKNRIDYFKIDKDHLLSYEELTN